jgi:hypothetical protein
VTESVAEQFRRSEITELLARYPGLRLVPSGSMTMRVEGTLRFCANGKKTEVIEDGYDVRIEAPANFPERMLGSLQDLAGLLGVEDLALAFRYCMLAATKRRRANKQLCPCGTSPAAGPLSQSEGQCRT